MATPPSDHHIKGSCLSTSVTYETTGSPPFTTVICHCDNCRKACGSSLMANSFYLKSQVNIVSSSSSIKTYEDAAQDYGSTLTRSFCSNCGSPLFTTNSFFEDVIIVTTGTMDNIQGEWKPVREYYCKRRFGWVPEVEGTQKMWEVQELMSEKGETAGA